MMTTVSAPAATTLPTATVSGLVPATSRQSHGTWTTGRGASTTWTGGALTTRTVDDGRGAIDD